MDATDTSNPNLNYGLVVDCGSSGSRVFVYCWPRHNGNPHELLDIQQMRDQHRKPVVMKIKPGMRHRAWLIKPVFKGEDISVIMLLCVFRDSQIIKCNIRQTIRWLVIYQV